MARPDPIVEDAQDRLTLRRAGPSDSEFAYRARRSAFKEYVEQAVGWDEDEERRLHRQRFETQDFRIIQLAGADVGVLALVRVPDCLKANQLFILPEYQGRGIGRECMTRVLMEARGLGVPVRLRVLKVNPRALAFYLRLGFTRIGEIETHDLLEKQPG
jgi:GNAT superfamily N-acetyltransferase